jgi:Tfp pilus assembly protein PilW
VRWLGTALIFLAGLFVLLLALGAHLQLVEARQLVAGGKKTEGTVTQVGSARRRSTHYRVSYTYPVGNVAYTKSDRSISYGDANALTRGAKIPVWYDAANPEVATTTAELAEQEHLANRIFFPLIGFALLTWAVVRIVRPRRAATAPG